MLLHLYVKSPEYSHKVKYMSTTYCTEYIMSNEQRYVLRTALHSVVPALGLVISVIEKYHLQNTTIVGSAVKVSSEGGS